MRDIDWIPAECLYIPGKVEGKTLQYLIDTGSSENILSRNLFNTLPPHVKKTLQADETRASLADGSGLLIYGTIHLNCRLRTIAVQITFKVANITDEAILGMKFLKDNKCALFLDKGIIAIQEQMLTCTGRHGEMLTNKVQVLRTIVMPQGSEMQIVCRLATPPSHPMGVVEHFSKNSSEILLAATLTQPDSKKRIVVRCLNTSPDPITLRAGTNLGLYTPVLHDQIFSGNEHPKPAPRKGNPGLKQIQKPNLTLPEHMTPLFQQAAKNCSTEAQTLALAQLLREYADVFSSNDEDVGLTNLVSHEIPVVQGTNPVRQPPRRLGMEKDQEVERQVKDLVAKGMVEPTDSSWSSPVVLVKKKDDSWRLCIDYRQLNAVTRKDAYPLPRIDDSLDALAGSVYFSTLDLLSGYWQVPLNEDAQEKAAFVTRGGLWKWRVLPFGLTSAPATFERLMEKVLHGLQWKSLLLYLDDVVVFSPDFDQHLSRLTTVLDRFRGANLKLKPSKCEILQKEVRYLGHVINREGVSTDPGKVQTVKDWPIPSCQTGLRTFLGFVGYYRKFCPDYATIAKPLSRMTAKNIPFIWDTSAQQSFDQLRNYIISAPVLAYPDFSKEFILDTDASLDGVGAVLSQIQDGNERALAYFSKTLSPAERNYCVTRRELLAIILATKHFRPYLYGKHFLMRTDHASLQWLCRRKEPSHQVARWLEGLAEYHFTLTHRAGLKHGNADGLSRKCIECKQCKSIETRDGGPSKEQLEVQDWMTIENGVIKNKSSTHSPQGTTSTVHSQTRQIGLQSELSKEVGPLQRREGSLTATLIQLLEAGETPTPAQIEQGNHDFKKLCSLFSLLRLKEGILQIKTNLNQRSVWCIVCPTELRPVIIRDVHTQHHSGINKTYQRIKLQWYWPGMVPTIRRAVRSCEVCQAAKNSNTQPAVQRQRLFAGRPWQVLSLDLVGPLTPTPRGNTMVLVIADHFTRWKDAIALPDGTTKSIAEALEKQVFCYFGVPERIHTDKGAQFESQLMAQLCQLWGVQKSHTTPYRPQGNGVVERGNRDLGNALRATLLHRTEEEWDLVLPQLTRSIRSTPHSFTGETANYMMFGRELLLPDTLIAGPPLEKTSRELYAQELSERMEVAYNSIIETQHQIRTTDKQEPCMFTTGDLVWLRRKRYRKGTSPKLNSKFNGPYTILKTFPNHTYLLDLHGRQSVESESRLKLHVETETNWGKAPILPEANRHPTRTGISHKNSKLRKQSSDLETEMFELLQAHKQESNSRTGSKVEVKSKGPTTPTEVEVAQDEELPSPYDNNRGGSQDLIMQPGMTTGQRPVRNKSTPDKLADFILYRVNWSNQRGVKQGCPYKRAHTHGQVDQITPGHQAVNSMSMKPEPGEILELHDKDSTLMDEPLYTPGGSDSATGGHDTNFVTPETTAMIQTTFQASKTKKECTRCFKSFHKLANYEQLRIHVLSHFVVFACQCGSLANRTETIAGHARRVHPGAKRAIYKIDRDNWNRAKDHITFLPKYMPVLPYFTKKKSTTAPVTPAPTTPVALESTEALPTTPSEDNEIEIAAQAIEMAMATDENEPFDVEAFMQNLAPGAPVSPLKTPPRAKRTISPRRSPRKAPGHVSRVKFHKPSTQRPELPTRTIQAAPIQKYTPAYAIPQSQSNPHRQFRLNEERQQIRLKERHKQYLKELLDQTQNEINHHQQKLAGLTNPELY